jgi:propanol-preferring alcohol dehydrogenase
VALAALDRGGTLAVAGIHLSQIPPLDYQEHLFQERRLRSVTANTRADGEELLALATRLALTVTTTPEPSPTSPPAPTPAPPSSSCSSPAPHPRR